MAQGVVVKNPLGAVGDITVLVVILSQSGVRICTDYRRTANPQLEPLKFPMKTANELR